MYLEENFEGVCNKSDPSWSTDALAEVCVPQLECTREGPIDMGCMQGPNMNCVSNALTKLWSLPVGECPDQDALCDFQQEIADSMVGCSTCEVMVKGMLTDMGKNSTCDMQCHERALFCNKDPEFSTCAAEGNPASVCYDLQQNEIEGCECHSSCRTCGYLHHPNGSANCITCANGSPVEVLSEDGTGICALDDDAFFSAASGKALTDSFCFLASMFLATALFLTM